MENVAEKIACKLEGHIICSMCGDCVICTQVEGKAFDEPGHMYYGGGHNYRCNNTYLKQRRLGGLAAKDMKSWWHQPSSHFEEVPT